MKFQAAVPNPTDMKKKNCIFRIFEKERGIK